MAVAVVIDEGAAVAPGFAGACNAGFFADVGEGAVTIVMVKDVFAVIGDEEVVVAVVVVIADADALPPAGMGEAGFLRDVGKGAVVIVVVQVVGGGCAGGEAVERCAVDEEDVGPAVVVVVEDGHTGTGGLDDVFFGGGAAEGDFGG